MQTMLRKEVEAYKQENRMLRDTVDALTQQIDNLNKQMTPRGTRKNVFESEVLKQQIVDKEREFARQLDHYRGLLAEKDNNITK